MAGMTGRYSSIKSAVLLTAVAIATTACASAAARPAVRPSPFPRAAGGSDDTTMPRPVAAPAPTPAPSLAARHLLDTAVGLRGVSYRLGGEDPGSGFDCSGFVRYVFAQHHVVLPRTVVEQFGAAHDIAPDEIAAGDLLFFSTIAPGPTHVGIALGPVSQGEFVHAPGTGGAVRVERFDTPYWQGRFVGAKRTSGVVLRKS
jgi:cell wall-associated NlpC family hydrolase